MNLHEMSVSTFHRALKSGDLNAVDMIKYYLERIERLDAQLQSIVCINENALQEARALDDYFSKFGLKGPLHGVPVLVKDNIETQSIETTAGSTSLKDYVPEQDATIIEKIKKAGGIVIGKANLHEFAIWGETISSVKGQTYNPYDLTRTPGGSSGGTGAAIAADFAMIGLGTDTINSVRSPASANNLVGFRPTLGLISRSGIVPYSYTQDTAGPLTRTLEDAVLCLDAIKGFDSKDEITAWGAPYENALLKNALIEKGLQGKRIGVLESLFGKGPEHRETSEVVKRAIDQMALAGATLVPLQEDVDTGYLVREVSVHLHDFKDHLNAYLSTLPEYMPHRTMQAIVDSGLFHKGVKDNLLTALSLSTDSDDYRQRLEKRQALQNRVMFWFAQHTLDAIVYPHQKQLVCAVGESQNERNGVISSVTGFPSLCIPAGFSSPSETAPLGIPIGMEILGRPFTEHVLVEIGYGYECRAQRRKGPVGFCE